VNIRQETPDDQKSIRAIHIMSFPGPDEVDLVDRLRADGDAVLSLVAVEGKNIVGHVMFSRMSAPFRALGLAPVAVAPNYRRRGYAAALIQAGIKLAKEGGWAGIFVLGDPQYYGRFGFNAAAAADFESPYAGPHFMFLQLGDAPDARSGRVDYAQAFSKLA
jgi:putative acetyltransferase